MPIVTFHLEVILYQINSERRKYDKYSEPGHVKESNIFFKNL